MFSVLVDRIQDFVIDQLNDVAQTTLQTLSSTDASIYF